MKLAILAIGRLKAGPELELFDDYAKRARGLGRACGITEITARDFAEAKLPDAPGRMTAEARLLAEAIPHPSFTIVLDERG
ncbi:MAG TPA: 23S rRNA (pseudouridine(1915)-N(3))-methyltransferase RlmH, partial [Nordella sp.]|nr:23S rRNA (pseudouridine(1915)-N(3))-methyltransferase RlmH [Nordella sp.]